ncbi:hypothetical protein ACIP93_32755 [Streptomyces sp. NPDC088745]|uniref:hypothetical protein n=1 Tax=Streptomyces sp. NPDC088745 TaxID=3365884 RepID=UPI003815BAF4
MTDPNTHEFFRELARDFQEHRDVSRAAAAHFIGIFAMTSALYDTQEEAEAEANRLVTQALENGEPWAKEWMEATINIMYPNAALVCESATKASTDPIAALQAVYGIAADVAGDLARAVSRRRNVS